MSFCKTLAPEARKEIAGEIAEEFHVSITRACNPVGIHKSYFYYDSVKDDSEVEAAIRQKAEDGCDGFWKIYHRLRNEGFEWNHKRVYRVYKAIHFNKRVPLRKRLPARVKNPLDTPERENVTWSIDFVTDVLQSNRKFRVPNVIDDCGRVAVAQKVAPSMPAKRVIRFMEEIIWEKGKPDNIRCDNGPEFISHEFQERCKGNIFRTLDEVREITDRWMNYYNNERPHDSLNNLAPMQYRLARTE